MSTRSTVTAISQLYTLVVVHVSRAKNLTWSQIAPRLGLARSRPARSRLDMRLGIALGRSRARLGARRALLLLAASLFVPPEARFASACTNILVTPGASSDASAILAYNADSGSLYGSLGHYPATRNNPPKGVEPGVLPVSGSFPERTFTEVLTR